jgi:hypothetical protein
MLEKYEPMKSQYEGHGNGEKLQYQIKEVHPRVVWGK